MSNSAQIPWARAAALVALLCVLALSNRFVDSRMTGAGPLPPLTPEQIGATKLPGSDEWVVLQPDPKLELATEVELTEDEIREHAKNDSFYLDLYMIVLIAISILVAATLCVRQARKILFVLAAASTIIAAACTIFTLTTASILLFSFFGTFLYVRKRDASESVDVEL